MGFKSFRIDRNTNYKFDLTYVKNWDVIVDNLALVLLKTNIREYKNINVTPSLKSNNRVEIKYSCYKPDGRLDEYILRLNLLGCKDLGYNSSISQVWRDCLEMNFGKEYHDFVSQKLSGLEK